MDARRTETYVALVDASRDFYLFISERAAWGVLRDFFPFSFPYSADHERDWPPPCKVVFPGWQPIC